LIEIVLVAIIDGEELFCKLLFIDLERETKIVQSTIMVSELCVDVA